ncbi:aldehyde dehydrogenase family protein [Variovorax paradoxus]|uniref:aldehyde dehydrogenase family protein n=1 Tax=Variovorax paradoxus TaxID=34073 RepID=UPI003ECF29B6
MNKKEGIVSSPIPKMRDLFYGGKWHKPVSGRYLQTFNPADRSVITEVADAGRADVELACVAAHAGYLAWRRIKPVERAERLRTAAEILRSHAEELAMIDALNTGNPVAEMVVDANIAAATLEYFAGIAGEAKGETIPMGDGHLNYTLREPLGVVARIVAFNHPLLFAGMKIAAPLASGNSVIVKPSDQAPLSTLRMAELLQNVFPPGVMNVLPGGLECGEALTSNSLVQKVTLIGSVGTGKRIMRGAADSLKGVLLELGGKNALIAYPDADLDKLVPGIVKGMNFTWAGQSCGSTSRVYLHESIHDEVLQRVVDLTNARHKPGLPTDWSTTMGPLISEAQFDRVMGYIASGKAEGARLVTGGKPPSDQSLSRGNFIEPTIFAEVTMDMKIAREEIFGPVLSVLKWSDEEQMIDEVNSLDLGLTASIWTNDLNTAHRAAQRVQAGYVWVNNSGSHFLGAPFGGYKSSGIGREECIEELLEFTQTKNVNIQLS